MRVLQISKFYPPVSGGIESTVRALTEGLNGMGISTDVLCCNTRHATLFEQAVAGYQVTRAASLGRVLSTSVSMNLIGQTWSLCLDYDILHVHMPDPMAALALWAARGRLQQRHLVVHWHSDVVRQRRALKLYEPLQNWLLSRADAVVATSEAYAEASEVLRAWRGKVVVIPIGISDNLDSVTPAKVQAIRQRYHWRKIVFALGRFTYYKGFDVLVESARHLPPDCVVLIGGDGDPTLTARLQSASYALGLAGRVHFLGRIEESELPDYFSACDVFCLPSTERSEAFGVAQLEAMCMAKPVVSAEVPGSGVSWINQHGHTGLTVPVRDARALGAALNTLLGDAELGRRMGQYGRERFLAEFQAQLMAQRVLALYQNLKVGTAAPTRH